MHISLSQAPEQLAQVKQQAQAAVQDMQWKDIGDAITTWQTALAGAATSGLVVTQALKDLPRTAQELAKEIPSLAQRIKTAGIRPGSATRTEADISCYAFKLHVAHSQSPFYKAFSPIWLVYFR